MTIHGPWMSALARISSISSRPGRSSVNGVSMVSRGASIVSVGTVRHSFPVKWRRNDSTNGTCHDRCKLYHGQVRDWMLSIGCWRRQQFVFPRGEERGEVGQRFGQRHAVVGMGE